jgi:hypothetical protein
MRPTTLLRDFATTMPEKTFNAVTMACLNGGGFGDDGRPSDNGFEYLETKVTQIWNV